MKIIEMLSICALRLEDVILKANIEIENGWQPWGGIIRDEDNWPILIMVKYET